MKQSTLAERIIQKHGTNDPFKVCANMGVKVFLFPLVDFRGFYMHKKKVETIVIADDLGELAARFVCAHELGHKINHSGLNRLFMDTRTRMVADKYENEADAFAYHFVFPCDDSYFTWQEVTLLDMAACLNVSPCTVQQRISEIL